MKRAVLGFACYWLVRASFVIVRPLTQPVDNNALSCTRLGFISFDLGQLKHNLENNDCKKVIKS